MTNKWVLVCVLKVNVKLTGLGNSAIVDWLPFELNTPLIFIKATFFIFKHCKENSPILNGFINENNVPLYVKKTILLNDFGIWMISTTLGWAFAG